MVECPPYRGRILRSVVGRDFDGNIEVCEYAVGMPAGDEDNLVRPFSTVVFRLGMGEYVRAHGREWSRRDRVGAQFALR